MYTVGQKVQCTKEKWLNGNGIANFFPPKKGEMVTVKDTMVYEGKELLNFEEQAETVWYPAKHFTPQQKMSLNT
ncbi:hypothetical protein [Flagellimonas sp.]|uniref:hypothetical protein n=1 Tax=Flagellimonas sp. TaxID=2058762 RepID=UPI003F4A0B7D